MADYARNKKATFNFDVLEEFEAGIVLYGYEVKAVRGGKVSMVGSYIILRSGEAWLKGTTISYFQEANTPDNYNPERERKLLLSKKELKKLEKELNTAGLTVIPLALYNAGRNIKLKIALARGKKKADKRESIKQRDVKRDIDRTLKNQ